MLKRAEGKYELDTRPAIEGGCHIPKRLYHVSEWQILPNLPVSELRTSTSASHLKATNRVTKHYSRYRP